MNIKITETADPLLLTKLNKDVQNLHATMYPGIFKRFDEAAVEMSMRAVMGSNSCKCFIATYGTEIGGYMITYIREYPETAFTYPRKSLYIDHLAVLGGFRNKGLGKSMMDYAHNLALYSGLRRIEVDHWSANTIAAEFFRKQGYRIYREMLMKEI